MVAARDAPCSCTAASSTSRSTCSRSTGSASIIEQALGTPRFLLVYFVSGLAGSAGALWSQLARSPSRSAPPGAIFGIIGALLILEYLATGSLMGQAMILILVNLALTFAVPGISKGGHLGGLVGGIVATYALMHFRFDRSGGSGRSRPAVGVVASRSRTCACAAT